MDEPGNAGASPIPAVTRGMRPEFMAIGSMLSVQLGAALAVPVMAVIGPAMTTALRLLWAGMLLAFIVRPRFDAMTVRQWLAGALLGLVIAGLTLSYFVAISRIPMGPATAIEFLGPLGVALAWYTTIPTSHPGSGSRDWRDAPDQRRVALDCGPRRSRLRGRCRMWMGGLHLADEESRNLFPWAAGPFNCATCRCSSRRAGQLCCQGKQSDIYAASLHNRTGFAHPVITVRAGNDGAPENEYQSVRDLHEHGARDLCHTRLRHTFSTLNSAPDLRYHLCRRR